MIKNTLENTLKKALAQHEISARGFGERDVWASLLTSGAAQARLWLNIGGVLMVVIFLLMIVLVIFYRDSGPSSLAIITGLSGVTLAGTVKVLMQIARTLFEFRTFDTLIHGIPASERAEIARGYLDSIMAKNAKDS